MTDDEDSPIDAPNTENVPFDERYLPKARVSDELLHSGGDRRPGHKPRHDGWTPERISTFLHTLAACGVVTDAARAAGMSARSAYQFRTRAEGGPFGIAWAAAERLAARRLADVAVSRALHGCVEVIVRDGEVQEERHRFDNRLTMSTLTRLDKLAQANDDDSRAARFVVQGFAEFVEIVSRGGAGAAEFIAAREHAEFRPAINDVARTLERLAHYLEHGAGLPPETETQLLGSAAQPEEAEAPRPRPADPCGLLRALSDHEPEPEPDEAIDPAASLTEADQAEALRRYYRWMDDDGEGGSSPA